MTIYNPLKKLPPKGGYKKGDVLLLCGELFGRGYANGLVEEARNRGMTIIGTTVGRRDTEGKLRSLDPAELSEAEASLGGKIINIPLEAGFDLEPANDGCSPVDQFKGVKPDEWANVHLDWERIEQSRQNGIKRFCSNMAAVAVELEKLVPEGANLLLSHIMGGGMIRSRIYMPLFNRVFKGQGDRYLSSETFWNTDMGKLCKLSFDEITADTFGRLIDETASLRAWVEERGGKVAYSAYGYHGCEVLINGKYTWQSYTAYVPGWAKMRLEGIAEVASGMGISAAVFNSPEIQTNSSALFMGVEISLYPLLTALEKENCEKAKEIREECRKLLRDDASIDEMLKVADGYLASPVIAQFGDLNTWPHHNTLEQTELMLNCSKRLMEMNRDPKDVVCAHLSGVVVSAVGKLIIDTMWAPEHHVFWLNHDIIAKRTALE